jgi:hypothetical protein
MPAPTLGGRLLCASQCAYAVTDNGALRIDAGDPLWGAYYAGAGFVQQPTGFVAGDSNTNACLVGVTADGVVLAFRGTLAFDLHHAPTLLDWLNNFNATPVPVAGFPGSVHPGFLGATASVLPGALAEVRRLRAGPLAAAPVLVTGHSKGGAMASLAAWQLQGRPEAPAGVVTFAAAKPGDRAFAAAYNGKVAHVRYEYGYDIVPLLPPSPRDFLDLLTSPLMLMVLGGGLAGLKRFDYGPVGALRYIDSSLAVRDDSPTLTTERFLGLVQLVIRQRFQQIVVDHAIDFGSGYMSAVCPTGLCPSA